MPTTLLYYPTIDVPTSGVWIRKTLLYWDHIASIVPESYDGELPREKRYSPEIQCLYKEGVFRPLSPGLLFGTSAAFDLGSEIKSITQTERFKMGLPTGRDRWLNIPVYREKVSSWIFKDLASRGLAAECLDIPDGEKFYFFEPNVYELYMALLAEYLAKVDEQVTTPGTDKQSSFDLGYAPTKLSQRSLCLSTHLRELLPMPKPEVSIRAILRFRSKHKSELLAFRAELEKIQETLSNCESTDEIRSELEKARSRIDLESIRLGRALKSSKISATLGSIQAFFKPTTPTIVGAAAIVAKSTTPGGPLPVSWLIATSIGSGALEVAAYLVKKKEERTAAVDKSPFAYFFLADEKFSASRKPAA
jgi:hypothetical protein